MKSRIFVLDWEDIYSVLECNFFNDFNDNLECKLFLMIFVASLSNGCKQHVYICNVNIY